MVKLLTEKQKKRQAKYAIVLKTFAEVEETCIGSLHMKCQETSARLAKKGVKFSTPAVYKLLNKQQS